MGGYEMRKSILFIMCITITIVLMGGCKEKKKEAASISGITKYEAVIYPEVTKYSPAMSSIPGIPLAGVFKLNNNLENIKYHWIANEGVFLDWNEGSGKVTQLGKEVKNNGGMIYWSVDGSNKNKMLRFNVVLKVEDASTSKLLAETKIEIEEDKEGVYRIVGNKAKNLNFLEQKKYEIPYDNRKENYSAPDFKHLYSEYLKLNNAQLETSSENDKTGMSKEDKLKYYTICDITPKEVKEEIGCQIFKVNYSCETYVVYKSKVFGIGLGFGGFGVVSLTTCDFDGNGQKDLIYTFSWGSGLHRSQIGVFNFSKEKEEWLDFVQMNKDIMLEKISDNNFKVYIADIDADELDFIHFKLSKQEQVADVQSRDGKTEVTRQ
jgi:hypothetical protein